MKNNITEIVFILDRSGSMSGFEADTIGGFNATIEKQKEQDGKVYVSTVLFDNESEVIHDRIDINEIKRMTRRDYQVGGCTALLDAIGGAIHHIGNIHKYARPEDIPEHTIFPSCSFCFSMVALKPPMVSASKPDMDPLLSRMNTISVILFFI